MTSQDSNDSPSIEGETTITLNNATLVLNFESVEDLGPDGPLIFKGCTIEPAHDVVNTPVNPCREEPSLAPPERPPCNLGSLNIGEASIYISKEMQNHLYGMMANHNNVIIADTDSIFIKHDQELIDRFDNLTTQLVELGEAIFGFEIDGDEEDEEDEESCTLGCCSELPTRGYEEGTFEYSICEALDMCEDTLLADRAPQYKRQPAEYVDMETMWHQLKLKVIRAGEAIDHDKQIDEMKDTANYAILMLARMIRGDFL